MSLNPFTKMKINEILKHPIDDIYHSDYIELTKTNQANQKCQIEEILTYLIEKAQSELNKGEAISIKLFSKSIFSISLIIDNSYEYKKLPEEIVTKVYNILEEYSIGKKTYPALKDSELVEQQMTEVSVFMNQVYPRELPENNLEEKYQLTKDELNIKEKELKETLQKVKTLEYELSKITSQLDKQKEENKTLLHQKEKIETAKKDLEREKNKLEKQLESISTTLEEKTMLLEENRTFKEEYLKQLENYSELYNNLEKEVNETKETQQKNNQAKAKQQQLEQEIEKIIIEQLFKSSTSLDDLILILNENNYHLNKKDIYHHLNNLKKRINLSEPSLLTYPATYKINTEPSLISEPFYLKPILKENCMDILVISDLHIKDITTAIPEIDKLYEYAIKKDIKIILNLGDLYDCGMVRKSLSTLTTLEKNLDDFIKYMPETNEIYNLILGGNHEQDFLKLGIDPLQRIATNRSDYINLGYTNQRIILGSSVKKNSNTILLHHPKIRFNENTDLTSHYTPIKGYLDNYHLSNQLSLNDTYINLIGHTHKSELDITNAYCTIPSYLKPRCSTTTGAWHLKIYFDDKINISYITCIPLIINDKLIPISEIHYEKIKKKN